MKPKQPLFGILRIFLCLIVGLFWGAILASCSLPSSDPVNSSHDLAPVSTLLAASSENGVKVEISLEKDLHGEFWLAARFTPVEAGFHLYSKDLPRDGLEGIGRPTLLEIPHPDALQPDGELTADQAALEERFDAIDQSLPVYPEGPVTLRLPVTIIEDDHSELKTELSITYMACSASVCLPPVIDKRFSVEISK